MDTLTLVLQILASPVAVAIIGWLYFKATKKKASAELIQQLFVKVLASVKAIEKELDLPEAGKLDPRMQKALDIFNALKLQFPIKLASDYLGIDLSKLKAEDIQDIIEKLLHAKKLSLDFDVVTEIKNKLSFIG